MRKTIKLIISHSMTVIQFICVVIGALVIVGILTLFWRSFYNDHKPEYVLYGEWEKVDSEDGYNGHTLTFEWNGEYYNSNQEGVAWNYEYIEPDSLILYHHGFYEERYKILNITKDTIMVRLSEYIFHTSENGKEIEAQYGDGLQPTYIYVRKK